MTLFQPPQPPEPPRPPEPPKDLQPPSVPQFAPVHQRRQWTPPDPERARRTRRTTDLVVSISLLAIGFLGAIFGIAVSIVMPTVTESIYADRGVGFFEPSRSGQALSLLLWSHILLFIGAAIGTIYLLRKKRVAFWVPLAAGFIAAVTFWVIVITYIVADHTLRFVA